jgi:hypothetical protein
MAQTMYAHMNKSSKKKNFTLVLPSSQGEKGFVAKSLKAIII